MRQISIKSLMLYVSFFAVGLAALRNANDVWAGMILLLMLATLVAPYSLSWKVAAKNDRGGGGLRFSDSDT